MNFLRSAVAPALMCFLVAGNTGATEVPFEIVGGIVLVKASLNGTAPLPFILDTGATECLLTPQAANRVGLGPASGAGEKMARSVAVGEHTVPAMSFIIHDPLQAISLRLDQGINYAGILGYPFLSKFAFSIDYQRKRLDLLGGVASGTALKRPQAGIRVPFVLRDRLIHVTGMINGRGPVTFIVDTGSAEVLLLPQAAEKLRLPALSANRADGIRFTTLERISVGQATVTNVPAIIHRLHREGAGALSYDGILGYPFLSQFKTTFNYQDKVLILEPNIDR